ncbi:hypothetical protein P879_05089 [Paragonimus westermani]|uniref:Metalloendopeptidase n=1 Tax=Paragonimus westermani TaxID=34504 RepID=A0A8T0DB05_9TREM|nr:hypothetical protein P879_05089 [Paragonimus westermani]
MQKIPTFLGLLLFYLSTNLVCCEFSARQRRSLVYAYAKPWPNGIIPYRIGNGNLTNSNNYGNFSDIDIKLIRKAMSTIEKETCVVFKEIEKQSPLPNSSYIEIVGREDSDCYSQLGMTGDGKNELVLNSLCRTVGQIMHELAHALGLMHELMRPDRDEHIVVHEKNILEKYLSEFTKIPPTSGRLWDRKFDFQSITLYDPFSFTSSAKPAWEPLNPLGDIPLFPLREKDLSFEDAAAINRLYECDAHCSKRRRSCRSDEFRTKTCRCETAESYAYRRCRDDRSQWNFCRDAVKLNKCYDQANVAIPFCRKTCGRCFQAGIFGKTKPPIKACLDLEPQDCLGLVAEGYCYFDGWTKLNCQRSCGLCPPVSVAKRQTYTINARAYLVAYQEGKCFNRYDDLKCVVFAERGDCQNNPNFMTSYCALACGICGGHNNSELSYLKLDPGPCRNYIDDERCDALANEGKCHGTTLKQCMWSCNQCGEKPTTRKPTTTPSSEKFCEDQSTMCEWLAERGRCETNRVEMLELCPRSCKFCELKCEDIDLGVVCQDVVQKGYCQSAPEYAKRCALSCGLCNPESTSTQPTLARTTDHVDHLLQNVHATPNNVSKENSWAKLRSPNDSLLATRRRSKVIKRVQAMQPALQAFKDFPGISKLLKYPVDWTKSKKRCINLYPNDICLSWSHSGYCFYKHVVYLCRKSCTGCFEEIDGITRKRIRNTRSSSR